MEREQFKVLVKAMKAVYAQPTFIPDEEPEEDITDEILGDAEEPDDMDGYDYEDPEDEV